MAVLASDSSPEEIKKVAAYWAGIFSDPAIQKMWDDYHALKGEPSSDIDDDANPIESILDELQAMQAEDAPSVGKHAQLFLFLQKFAAAQIKAINKSGAPLVQSANTRLMAHSLKLQLGDLEKIAPPKALKEHALTVKNKQRLEDGQKSFFHSYRNWLEGVNTDDQSDLLSAYQWKTASGEFTPLKSLTRSVDGFVDDRLKSPVSSIIVTKLVWDSLEFMTDVMGAHKMLVESSHESDEAYLNASHDGSQSIEDLKAELLGVGSIETTITFSPAKEQDTLNALNQQCIEKTNTETNVVGMAVETFFYDDCHAISEGLQDWFAVATATPRTIQAGQKALSELYMKEGTIAQQSYDYHHQQASEMIEKIALYDNGLHFVLLGIGALYGDKLVKKHGLKAPSRIWNSLKQQGRLFKSRPLTGAGAAIGGAEFYARHGELLTTDIAPHLIIGAAAGYALQRLSVQKLENKSFIFNLNADPDLSRNLPTPVTISNQKKPCYVLRGLAGYSILTGLAITASNAGVINHQSPEILQQSTDFLMAGKSYIGAAGTWLAFDKLDDFLYHKGFFGTGVTIGMAFSAAAIMTAEAIKNAPGMAYANAAKDRVSKKGKKHIRTMFLALALQNEATVSNDNFVNIDEARALPQREVRFVQNTASPHYG